MSAAKKLEEALAVVKALGLPRAQHNERSALCLLALCNMTPEKSRRAGGKCAYRHHPHLGPYEK
jgi:hypothetical protein